MSMVCRGCNREALHIRTILDGEEWIDVCDFPDCGNLSMIDVGIPDVYLARSGQKFANLCDKMGRPYEIKSKRHKKEVMDKLGVREAGGTVNGAPFGTKSWIEGSRDYRSRQFDKDRPKIRETLRAWKEKARGAK